MSRLQLSELNMLKMSGIDYNGRYVVTMFGSRIPPSTDFPEEQIVEFITDFLSQLSGRDYSVLYFHDPEKGIGYYNARLLHHIHSLLDHSLKKNTKTLYMVHPNNFLRVFLRSLWFLSRKFYEKIIFLDSIVDLCPYINLALIQIPSEVISYEERTNGPLVKDMLKNFKVLGSDLASIMITEKGLTLPPFLSSSITRVQEAGINVEGIFRISPNINDMKEIYKNLTLDTDLSMQKPAIATAVIKKFLSSLPVPLLGNEAWSLMKSTAKYKEEKKLKKIREYLKKLPEVNKFLLGHIFNMVDNIVEHSSINKMDFNNLSIVLAPNLLWGESKHSEMTQNVYLAANLVKFIFENKVTLFDFETITSHQSRQPDLESRYCTFF